MVAHWWMMVDHLSEQARSQSGGCDDDHKLAISAQQEAVIISQDYVARCKALCSPDDTHPTGPDQRNLVKNLISQRGKKYTG